MSKLVKHMNTGRKILVDYVADVNKVPYYVESAKPYRVYTALEIRELNKYK